MNKYNNIDEYIMVFPEEIKERLTLIRKTIASTVPEAVETISYQMPTFKMKKNLIHFAAFKNHIGIYPGVEGIVEFQDKLSKYKTSKGAIQFPHSKEIPLDLIVEIVKYNVNKLKKNTNN